MVSAFPDLPRAASPMLWALRQQELDSTIKVAPTGTAVTDVKVTDLTGSTQGVNNSLFQIQKDFDDFNVMELTGIARSNSMSTENESYVPIKTLAETNRKYNPQKIVALQGAQSYINSFDYDVRVYLPELANGPSGQYIYLSDGNIVIDLVNINFERVEVDFLTFENVFDDTMYI